MANRIPLIVNPDASQIQELPSGDTLIIGEGGLGVFGSVALGNDSNTDQITLSSRFNSHLIPTDNNRNLGSSSLKWNQAHIGTVNATTLNGNGVVPIGGIIMWSGTVSTIPSNFKLCDGNNNTPNLTNKFIIGAISDQSVSGITTAATTITGSNTVTGGDKDAVLASHTHGYQSANHPTATGPEQNQGGGVEDRTTFNVDKTTTSTGINASGTTKDDGSVSATNANLPPYFALAYIMRTT